MTWSAVSTEVFIIASIIAAIGAYGITASRNLLRILLSIEVLFNAVLLMVVAVLASNPVLGAAFSIILISVVSAEVVVVVAVIIAFYRTSKSFDSSSLEEGGV
jgi:NAD(P)H-quinone oxidoreductase subunit 4L